MGKRFSSLALFCVASTVLAGCLDTDAPNITTRLGTPEGWFGLFPNDVGIGLTFGNQRSGVASVYMSVRGEAPRQAILSQSILSDNFLGARVRLSAWMKPENVAGEWAGLWMRIDGEHRTLAFDNMSARPVLGSGEWREVSVVLDIPSTAVGIDFGALFKGTGTLLIDDIRLETVSNSVPVTHTDFNTAEDSTGNRRSFYSNKANTPTNLDFEGVPVVTNETVTWLKNNTVSLTTTDPTLPLTDLDAFGQMIGSAHLVGLGEGTHGTREFQRMKHRMLRYLVEQKGFTHFAMEAGSSESDAINHYVLTGQGDPTRLLSALRAWIWNTQEVLDMVRWMREWNSTAPADKRVQFHGFDFQDPRGAMDTVEAFVGRVDPARSDFVRTRFVCFDPYKSNGATPGASAFSYSLRLATSRAACALGAKEVYDLLAGNAAVYTAARTEAEYAVALHSAQLLQRWEAYATVYSVTNVLPWFASHDSSMAENVRWIRDRAGANAKVVLWAHNDHIIRAGAAMGSHLHTTYSNDYVPVGFAFGSGTLNAVYGTSIQVVRPDTVPTKWIERAFIATGTPQLLFDTRLVAGGGAVATALRGPIRMRTIGSTYSVSAPAGFFGTYLFPVNFDLLFFVGTARETTRLPSVF